MNNFTIVPIEPQTATMKFHDIPLLEVLGLIQQLGFAEVELFDPNEFICTIRIDEGGAMHIIKKCTSTNQMGQPPSLLWH